MKTTRENTCTPIIWNSWLRLMMVALWFAAMSIAAYYGLIVHAFVGFASLTVLAYLTIRQANARMNYLKKKRVRQLGNYNAGEGYMEIFDSNKRSDL